MDSVQLTDRGAARAKAGHPWIWRQDVKTAKARVGAVRVVDRRGRMLASALWSQTSPVALRIYALGEQAWSEQLLDERIGAAIGRRRELFGEADAWRAVHAEADDLPGLFVDRYGDVAVVQIACEALDRQAEAIGRILRERLRSRAIVLRNDGSVRDFEGLEREPPRLLLGDSGRASFHEGTLALEIDALADSKTGSFLDQRENHVALAAYARGRVLDTFTYHGGFALQMAKAGAKQVIAVDENAQAIERARANAARNGLAVSFVQANAFDELRRLEAAQEHFDVVILDPPALAKRSGPLASAQRAYHELNLRALRLLRPEGILVTCSCSARMTVGSFADMLAGAAADARRTVQILEQRGAGRDHPERAGVPATAYLKCWVIRAI